MSIRGVVIILAVLLAGASQEASAQTMSSAGPGDCGVCNNGSPGGVFAHRFDLLGGGQFPDSYCDSGPFPDGAGCHYGTWWSGSCADAHWRCDWMEEAALLARALRIDDRAGLERALRTPDAKWLELPGGDGYFQPTCEPGFVAIVDGSGNQRVVMQPLTGTMSLGTVAAAAGLTSVVLEH